MILKKKIKLFSILSILFPFLAINVCLLTYKFLSDIKIYPNEVDWNESLFQYNVDIYKPASNKSFIVKYPSPKQIEQSDWKSENTYKLADT